MAVELIGSSTPSTRGDSSIGSDVEVVACAPNFSSRSTLPWRSRPKWKSSPTTTMRTASASTSTRSTNDSGDSWAWASSKRQHDGGVDAGRGEQLEALLGVGEQLRCRLGAHDRRRVAVEREHDRTGAESASAIARTCVDHRLVAEVDAVVGADRDDGALAGPRRRVELGDHLHGRATLSARRPAEHASRRARTRGRPAGEAIAGGRTTAGLAGRGRGSYTASSSPAAVTNAHGPSPAGASSTRADGDRRRRRLVDDDLRQRRAPRPSAGSSSHVVGRRRLGDRERPDGRAAQVAQVGAAPEQRGRGRRPACGCRCRPSTSTSIVQHRSAVRSRSSGDVEPSTRHRAGCALHLDALAGQLVQAPAVDLQRRHHRRHLLDVAGELLGHDAPATVVERRRSAMSWRGDHGTVGVERVGLDAEHDLAGVALASVGDEAQQAGHVADADHEHAGGAGVERAGVTDAALAEAPAQHARRRRGW